MSSEFRCAQCGRLLQAGGGTAGTRILCPGCGAFSTIPATDVGPAIEFRCTECNKLLRTAHDTAGKQAKCPECGTLMTVPKPGAGVPDETLPYVPPPAQPSDEAASPFAPGGGQPADAGDPENPYLAPTQYGQPPQQPFAVGASMAASRVSGPATALIVTGGLGVGLQVLNLLGGLLQIGVGMGQAGANPFPIVLPFGMVIAQNAICLILGIVVIMGAVKMKNLENYGWAMASAIIAMVPCISPCCVLGLPFGIWALVVLSDAQVKAAFRS